MFQPIGCEKRCVGNIWTCPEMEAAGHLLPLSLQAHQNADEGDESSPKLGRPNQHPKEQWNKKKKKNQVLR